MLGIVCYAICNVFFEANLNNLNYNVNNTYVVFFIYLHYNLNYYVNNTYVLFFICKH